MYKGSLVFGRECKINEDNKAYFKRFWEVIQEALLYVNEYEENDAITINKITMYEMQSIDCLINIGACVVLRFSNCPMLQLNLKDLNINKFDCLPPYLDKYLRNLFKQFKKVVLEYLQ